MLELPDDLDPAFVARIVQGANAEQAATPPFALLVCGDRPDLEHISPRVDFRELAMYRQGSHLAVTFASDNRGMSTYSSVYPLLLSAGFPNVVSTGSGVAGLGDFASDLGAVLIAQGGLRGLSQTDFTQAVTNVLSFLATAYDVAGNELSSSSSNWWRHVDDWADVLSMTAEGGDGSGLAWLYGCAGLPVPAKGLSLGMSPKEYLGILNSRWTGSSAIAGELVRLQGIDTATEAATTLLDLDWQASHARTSLRSNSAIALVALAIGTDRRKRARGWSRLSEVDFRSSYVEAKGKLRLLRNDVQLLPPWAGALPVLVAGIDEWHEDDGELVIEQAALLIPFRGDQDDVPSNVSAGLLAGIDISGEGGCVVTFQPSTASLLRDAVRVEGTLTLSTSKKAPHTGLLECRAVGLAARVLVDRCTTSFTIVRSNEVALWAKPRGRSAKASLRGPAFASSPWIDASQLQLDGSGSYEIAIAWGGSITSPAPRVGELAADQPWVGLEGSAGKCALDIWDEVDVHSGQVSLFRLKLASSTYRPTSPLVAAAHGMIPDTSRAIADTILGVIEQRLMPMLATPANSNSTAVLGCVILSDSDQRQELVDAADGVCCSSDLRLRIADLSPTVPTSSLREHHAYRMLRQAYANLGIPSLISTIEQREKVEGLTVSRVPLQDIPKAAIDNLLGCYRELLAAAVSMQPSDRFWARHPFSVCVYSGAPGLQSAQALLLSPLHPLRLAWAWAVQVGLREAFDDGVVAASSLALLDGVFMPSACTAEDAFGEPVPFLPVPIDASPEEVHLGWHASAPIAQGKVVIPEWMVGYRFPVEGVSGLSAASVRTAIADLLRVSPHIQSLRIGLSTNSPSRRSTAVDEGLMSTIEALALGSPDLDGVAGVRIRDSMNRLGLIPQLSRLQNVLIRARPGFNVEWIVVPPNDSSATHLTFMEGSAAKLALIRSPSRRGGWIAEVPLRRTPVRGREQSFSILDFALDKDLPIGAFGQTLRQYETGDTLSSYCLKILPDLAGIKGLPDWLVATDLGVNPRALTHAATDQANSRYVLWDWRPATTVRASGDVGERSQPYFVLAAVPQALNNALLDRLRQLQPALSQEAATTRIDLLVQTLASRAIGLNTLLSIGHHQATGALGFFFALRSLELWQRGGVANDLRLVIPVDAVDPFLRESGAVSSDGSLRRADLLAVHAVVAGDGHVSVALVPIEIKHYGLGEAESEPGFPLTGESRLDDHVDQLRTYLAQLDTLCESYREASGSRSSIIGQRLAAVLDAASQLSPSPSDAIPLVLSSVALGTANIQLGKGLLLWYQPGASTQTGAKAVWDEIDGSLVTRRIEVRINPAAFDSSYWLDQPGAAHEVVLASLESAVDGILECVPIGHEVDVEGLAVSLTDTADADDSSLSPPGLASLELRPTNGATSATAESNPPVDHETKAPLLASNARKSVSPEQLEQRYATLLAALREFGVRVNRPEGGMPYVEGPSFVEYAVSPAYGVSVNRIESQLENIKLRLKLGAEATIGCTTTMGKVLLSVPKADSERYYVDSAALWSAWARPEMGFSVPVGEDVKGTVVALDFADSNSPHILVAGVTGSGKSEALLTMLHGAARHYSPTELRLKLIDPKQTELTSLASMPHLDGSIGWESSEAIALLEDAVEEMEKRYGIFRTAGSKVRSISDYRISGGEMARWLLVLDEYADLVSDDGDRKKIEKCLQRISQKARAAGIHLIVSTQKPVVQVVNTVVKGNLPGKLALRVNTSTESRVILDEVGAEQLVGKGDAILKVGNSKIRIQCARYSG